MRRLATLITLVAGLFGLGLLVATSAAAHAVVVSSNPPDGARLADAPSAVSVTFDESVGLGGGGYLRVVDQVGRRVDNGSASHPGGDGTKISVPAASRTRRWYVHRELPRRLRRLAPGRGIDSLRGRQWCARTQREWTADGGPADEYHLRHRALGLIHRPRAARRRLAHVLGVAGGPGRPARANNPLDWLGCGDSRHAGRADRAGTVCRRPGARQHRPVEPARRHVAHHVRRRTFRAIALARCARCDAVVAASRSAT